MRRALSLNALLTLYRHVAVFSKPHSESIPKLSECNCSLFPTLSVPCEYLVPNCIVYILCNLGLKYAPWIITDQECQPCDFLQSRRSLPRGRILGRNWDKRLDIFPLCYSQSPLLSDFTPLNCGLIITNLRIYNLRTSTPQKFADLRLRKEPKNLRICDLRTNKKNM